MTFTNDERRKVAARLRALPIDTYAANKELKKDGLFIDASLSDEVDYSQIYDVVLGCFPAEHMHPGDYEELHERLADFIDRPTCRNVYDEKDGLKTVNGFQCSECGDVVEDAEGYYISGTFNYCPCCGAEVVSND